MRPLPHLALVALLTACERSAPSPPEAPPTRPPLALRGPRRTPRPEDPAPPSEHTAAPETPLPEVIARCIARGRERLSPELAGAIDVLGIPSLLEDGCRLDVATRLRDPSLCDGVSSSAVREACGMRAAITASAPDRCPSTPGLLGRDPVCVAVASHTPGLCAAAPGSDRGRCLALTRVDARLCARIEPPFREGCVREVTTLSEWIRPQRGEADADCEVSLDLLDPGADASVVRSWRLLAHRRGAWLDVDGSLWLVDPAGGWPRATASAGEEPLVAVKVRATGAAVGVGISAEARVILPDALSLDTRDESARATATFATVPSGRGGAYAVTVRIEGARAGLGRTLSLHAQGFVRDVVSASALRPW